MTTQTAPPVLSTPETHTFENPNPPPTITNTPRLSDDEIWEIYEISRTAREVWEAGYKKVALQFPDQMLRDATRVFERLEVELRNLGPTPVAVEYGNGGELETDFNSLTVSTSARKEIKENRNGGEISKEKRTSLYILADTSYGSCCVDEIAAEHVEAEVVIHYGRSCLSPTARLPVIYVFTSHPLPLSPLIETFESTFLSEENENGKGKEEKIVLMADITYHDHISSVEKTLKAKGWKNLVVPEVIHDPSSLIPNRKVPDEVISDLKNYKLFHISDPPPALLLTLSSRVQEMFIYPTTPPSPNNTNDTKPSAIRANTTLTLRRRYALTTRLSTTPIFGILINTLSVKNYLPTISRLTSLISRAGKKSYTFVVGKVNAAKIANFSEIGGWVVVGCWESSLIESGEFYRPVITPFELGLCLMGDERRIWTGEWRGDFDGLHFGEVDPGEVVEDGEGDGDVNGELGKGGVDEDEDSEEESAPPEYDLRTGRYVSHSRPMRTNPSSSSPSSSNPAASKSSKSLTRRAKGDLASVNGAVSPGAEYLRSQRTWTGLGSDFTEDAGTGIEEGRSGIARGYSVSESDMRR